MMAEHVRQLLSPLAVSRDTEWGLDHGTWQVLLHAFPKADVPVLQLAIDASRPPAFHYELGRRLAPLRDEGVFVCGSGNVVHNLPLMQWKLGPVGFDWAHRFNDQVRDLVLKREHQPLVDYASLGPDAALSIPTPEHYLPLLYCLGLQGDDDEAEIAADGLELGSISMMSVRIAPKAAQNG
jgi:4,5-DOPA dioxygenase extradiol